MAQKHYVHPVGGHHECEILGGGSEAEESESNWKACKKNPGHEAFISAQDFKDNYLPRVENDKVRDRIGVLIDLTVRLRVNWISPGRPDGYAFSDARGTDKLRVGTGFIFYVDGPKSDRPCFCYGCGGEKANSKFWRFHVVTAHHVVYDMEEAKASKVDLFYDDDNYCKPGGRMVTV
ncbi:hypothetical protein EGW08_010981 [Elysia chlorotica]|uniref:Uncharacterized protein n=1 Tax=Elysia chlorotica TaxID=188477 RepID=A0A433TI59_ELYCH|nr:hypothetical protein EGW08_010981 [Elysia chlorotica]